MTTQLIIQKLTFQWHIFVNKFCAIIHMWQINKMTPPAAHQPDESVKVLDSTRRMQSYQRIYHLAVFQSVIIFLTYSSKYDHFTKL